MMYTFPAREGRFWSVNFGAQGGMNWERVEIGGFFGEVMMFWTELMMMRRENVEDGKGGFR